MQRSGARYALFHSASSMVSCTASHHGSSSVPQTPRCGRSGWIELHQRRRAVLNSLDFQSPYCTTGLLNILYQLPIDSPSGLAALQIREFLRDRSITPPALASSCFLLQRTFWVSLLIFAFRLAWLLPHRLSFYCHDVFTLSFVVRNFPVDCPSFSYRPISTDL
jgi:hypothetical protein